MDAVTAKGSTPASNSPIDISTAISNIETKGKSIKGTIPYSSLLADEMWSVTPGVDQALQYPILTIHILLDFSPNLVYINCKSASHSTYYDLYHDCDTIAIKNFEICAHQYHKYNTSIDYGYDGYCLRYNNTRKMSIFDLMTNGFTLPMIAGNRYPEIYYEAYE